MGLTHSKEEILSRSGLGKPNIKGSRLQIKGMREPSPEKGRVDSLTAKDLKIQRVPERMTYLEAEETENSGYGNLDTTIRDGNKHSVNAPHDPNQNCGGGVKVNAVWHCQ